MTSATAGRLAVLAFSGALAGALPAAAQDVSDTAGEGLVLDTVTVNARVADGAGPIDGIVPADTATATKFDVPILETPQSVSVVGAEEMRTIGAQTVGQAFGYSAGISTFGGLDYTGDSLMARGFRVDPYYGSFFRDGLRYTVNVFDGSQELYGLERIEMLRGPSSVLYGMAAPGGVVNSVSKRPTDTPLHELNFTLGSFDSTQVSGDFGGPLDADGALTYRLTGLWRDADTAIDYVPNDRQFLAPALTWRPDERTSVTFLGLYQRDKSKYIYGLPAEGTVLPNPNGQIPLQRFVGEPDYDRYETRRKSATVLFEHEFETLPLTFRSGVRYDRADVDMPSIWLDTLQDDMRTITREAQDREDWSDAAVSDTSLQYDWSLRGTEHRTLLGFEATKSRHQTTRANRPADPLDLFDPVYGGEIGEVYSEYAEREQYKRYGLYLQDQIHFGDRWVVSLGGRHDWIDYLDRGSYAGSAFRTEEDSSAFTGRAGIIYLAPNGLAPYVSYSTSFEPAGGVDRNLERFDPTTGQQIEAGVRYQPPGAAMLLSAAVYQIKQQNVLVTDPVDPNFQIQEGEVRSRGVELEARASLTDNLDVIAAYAYTDARTTKSSPVTPENVGRRTGGVPYNQASLWADYGFGAFGLPGLRAGAGVRYIGDTTGYWLPDVTIPGYTLFDAMVRYDFANGWRVAVNGTNLADKEFVASCTYMCFYGEPRTVELTLTRTW